MISAKWYIIFEWDTYTSSQVANKLLHHKLHLTSATKAHQTCLHVQLTDFGTRFLSHKSLSKVNTRHLYGMCPFITFNRCSKSSFSFITPSTPILLRPAALMGVQFLRKCKHLSKEVSTAKYRMLLVKPQCNQIEQIK